MLRTLFYSLMLFAMSTALFAQQNIKTSLKGQIQTSDGKEAPFVTVVIKDTKYGTVTDTKGLFQLRNIPAGNHVLQIRIVGYQAQDFPFEATEGQNVVLPVIRINEDAQALNEVLIKGNINKFDAKETDYVARMPLANLENPQVYSAISKELLSDQVVIDYKDALRNVAGIAPNNNPAGGTGGTLRGFNVTTTVQNGMAVQVYQQDMINLERIEVIKGPSGTLFGSSIVGFGGLINQVTKKPFEHFKGEVSYTGGSYELSRFTVDINTPISGDKTVLLRVNAAAHNEGTFQSFGHTRMYTFAPSLSYKVDEKLSFIFDAALNTTNRSTVAYYQNLNKTSYRNFRDIPIDFKTSLGGENIDAQLTSSNYFTQAKYKISKNWTSLTNVAIGSNRIEHSNQIYPSWTSDTTFNRTISNYGPRIFTSVNMQQNFTGEFKIGPFKNRLLAGVDYYTFRSQLRYTNVGTYDIVNTRKSIPALNLEKVNALVAAAANSNNETKLTTYSAYFSDVINLTDKLIAMLSLRVDRFVNKPTVTNGVVGTNDYKQTAFSPKLGLVYQLLKDQVSVFGNYMNGFQNVAPVVQPDGTTSVFKPMQANQWETGIKAEAFGGKISGTLSYYNIDMKNATYIEQGRTVQSGSQESKGFEVELVANPVTGFNLIAGYAKNDAKISKSTPELTGKKVSANPEEYFNLWASYKFTGNFLKNIGLGIGGNYVADSYFDVANTITIPSYTTINASLFFDQPKWRFTIKGNNLANEKYWSNYGIAQSMRQILGNVIFKF